MSDTRRRNRLLYRSRHRGTKEMDVLLGSFAERHIGGFSESELDQYEALLAESDPDLLNWCLGLDNPPKEKMSNIMILFVNHKVRHEG